jgi:hypothetical protein
MTEAIINSVIAPPAIENIKQLLTKVSYCGLSDTSNHRAVKVFHVVIQYFVCLIKCSSSSIKQITVAQYIKQNLENCFTL